MINDLEWSQLFSASSGWWQERQGRKNIQGVRQTFLRDLPGDRRYINGVKFHQLQGSKHQETQTKETFPESFVQGKNINVFFLSLSLCEDREKLQWSDLLLLQ